MNIWDALRNSGKVIKEGLVTPNKFNKPAADRFKGSALPMLGVPGAVAETADELYKGNPGMAALAATGAIPGVGVVGSLVKSAKGADKGILLSHGSDVYGMLKALRNKDPVLTSPSMAVSRQELPYGESEVMLYPRPQIFDPANNPRSDLWSSDAYTYRMNPDHDKISKPKHAQERYRKDARLTEEYGIPNSHVQLATVLAAPRFSSYDQYLKSPTGAGRLSRDVMEEGNYNSYDNKLYERLNKWYASEAKAGRNWGDIDSNESVEESFEEMMARKEAMKRFLADNPDVLRYVNEIPQNYGELKYHGTVPLNRENIAAARFTGEDPSEELVRELRRKGIPIVPDKFQDQSDIANYVDYLNFGNK